MNAWVTIPTYNEIDNIGRLLEAIRELVPHMGIIVADDNSPDGTWRIVEAAGQRDDRVVLLRRMENQGRGAAGVDAFKLALEKEADVIMEMDADFSHDPKYIPDFLKAIQAHDLVLGSRTVKGGKDLRPSTVRHWLTAISSFYARLVLGVPVGDCNSGYRCFRRKVLEAVDLDSIRSIGPSIVQELLFKAHINGFSITEIPIVFPERDAGESNLNAVKLLQGFLMVLKLRGLHMVGKL